MSTVEKVALGVVTLATITTLLLPKRQTPQVIDAFTRLVKGALGTAMGAS